LLSEVLINELIGETKMKLHQYLFTFAVFLFTTLLFTTQVNAQVYKCTFVDVATRQSKVVYTDSPCQQTQKQMLTAIQTKSPPQNIQALQTAQLAQVSALDAAVTRAVLDRDFKLAKSIATTKEHWRLIAIAEGEAAQPVLTVANSQPEITPQAECAQAKNNFEYVSRNSWRDRDLVAAKKSVMYVACGMPEPVQNQAIFVGRTFGGLQTGTWYPPAYPYHANRPYGTVNHPHLVNHHYNQNRSFGGVSLSYKSRHFGLNVDSANVR
jgi:hypothetical protein